MENTIKSSIQLACQNYLEETRLAAQMRDHAARLRYPSYRSQLQVLAEEESGHAAWLQTWIKQQEASLPEVQPQLKGGRNDWERLRQDYEDDLSLADKYLHDAYEVDSENPELAEIFLKIRKQELDHRQILLRLVMRHDCYDS